MRRVGPSSLWRLVSLFPFPFFFLLFTSASFDPYSTAPHSLAFNQHFGRSLLHARLCYCRSHSFCTPIKPTNSNHLSPVTLCKTLHFTRTTGAYTNLTTFSVFFDLNINQHHQLSKDPLETKYALLICFGAEHCRHRPGRRPHYPTRELPRSSSRVSNHTFVASHRESSTD